MAKSPKTTAPVQVAADAATDERKIVTNQATAVVAAPAGGALSTEVHAFEAFAGAGTENVTISDVLIPRLGLLQALSPQLKKSKPEFIEGAQVGNIADLGTGDLFPEGVLFLPVYYRKQWLEWAPRSSGKGLIAIHDDDGVTLECVRDDRNKLVNGQGNIIEETAQWYGLNLSAQRRKCFIPMSSSQLKRSRKWMTMVTSERITKPDGSDFPAPIFYRTYALGSAEDSNEQGDWAAWTIARGLTLPEFAPNWQSILAEATKFRDALVAGEMRADLQSMDEGGASDGEGEGMAARAQRARQGQADQGSM